MSSTSINLVKDLGKNDYCTIKTQDTNYIFCGTPLVYEDMFYGFATEALKRFGYDPDDERDNGTLPEIRDRFILAFEQVMNVELIDVCTTY